MCVKTGSLLTLGQLFAPLDPSEFLSAYWPEVPYAAHHQRPCFGESIGLHELDTIDKVLDRWTDSVNVHYQDKNGTYLHKTTNKIQAREAYYSGGWLSFNSFHKIARELAFGMQAIAVELNVPRNLVSCVAIAAPKGTGAPLHFDAKEVIAVQIRGRKIWHLSCNTEVKYPSVDYSLAPGNEISPELRSYSPKNLGVSASTDVMSVEMSEGSVLFVPRGYWHSTQALEDTFSLSFVIPSPTHLDMLLARLRRELIPDPIWRSPLASHKDNFAWRMKAREYLSRMSEDFFQVSK